MTRALVYGLAVAGAATARALARRGVEVIAVDDAVTPERRALADELGAVVVERPDETALRALIRDVDLVCPSPGVPERHVIHELATGAGVEVVSEIELAYRWEQERPDGPRPMLAVTGTDGKTTTTLMTVEILRAAGLRTVDAGNTDTPLVDAIEQDLDAFVVECTSFRLAGTSRFRADAAVWLNIAPDHLDWHSSMSSYEDAKGRIFRGQRPSDVSIGFHDDPIVMSHLRASPARQLSFGLAEGDYHADGGWLVGPAGRISEVAEMRRALPHDITNALAASALALETGLADRAHVATALARFRGARHRLESIGTWRGVEWFDDSKATTPHAARAAIESFDSIVLIAGGYDKGVSLDPMVGSRGQVRTVLAIGATAPAVAAAFGDSACVRRVDTMDRAVEAAADLARPGDVVLLSPGCASFDQYPGFEARGEDFREHALRINEPSPPEETTP